MSAKSATMTRHVHQGHDHVLKCRDHVRQSRGQDATMSAKNATMARHVRQKHDHVRHGRDHVRQRRDQDNGNQPSTKGKSAVALPLCRLLRGFSRLLRAYGRRLMLLVAAKALMIGA